MGAGTRVVRDKNELKKAYEDKVDKIIVEGGLAKKMKKAKAIRTMTPAKLAILGTALAAVGGGVAMSPFTLGASAVVSTAVAIPVAVQTDVSITVIIAVSSIGLTLLIAILKDYDIEAEMGDFRVVLNKRRKGD